VGYLPSGHSRRGQQQDNNLRLIRSRYQLDLPYEDMYAYTHDEAQVCHPRRAKRR
jgi:hypothetical protein